MSGADGSRFKHAQQLVLRAVRADAVLHQVVRFESAEGGRRFIDAMMRHLSPGFGVERPKKTAGPLVSLGLSFRGLEALNVPDGYLHVFRRLSPAFAEGAPARAVRHLGDTGASAPGFWDEAFRLEDAHAVVTLHGTEKDCETALAKLFDLMSPGGPNSDAEVKQTGDAKNTEEAQEAPCAKPVGPPLRGKRLGPPPGREAIGETHWVHFGYRDGLTNPVVAGAGRIEGRPDEHEPGELLLGEVRDTGDNPWSLVRLPAEVRSEVQAFFHHGSFGVLRRIEQREQTFRQEVGRWARALAGDRGFRLVDAPGKTSLPPAAAASAGAAAERDAVWPRHAVEEFVRAKLCGRWPDGQVMRPAHVPLHPPDHVPESDFDFNGDPQGAGCPFGAHIRRMNPRSGTGDGGERVAHVRPRPLFRRGMPYGPWFDEKTQDEERGLLGLFFCTDLADQFEHLLGEWADRLPLGFPGDRHGKDPLIGAHDHPQASLLVPRRMPVNADTGKEPPDPSPLALYGFRPFVRTRGTVYAFYPPLKALERLAKAQPDWAKEEDPWLV